MIIGTFFLAVALHVGIVLTVDLFTNPHHSTTQSNHS
ncbi:MULTISPECIES: transcriptional regulator [unclassified Lysinibacillus]